MKYLVDGDLFAVCKYDLYEAIRHFLRNEIADYELESGVVFPIGSFGISFSRNAAHIKFYRRFENKQSCYGSYLLPLAGLFWDEKDISFATEYYQRSFADWLRTLIFED